jgi:hypothetical protein
LLWSKPTARRRACPMVASAEWQVNNSWSCIVWCRSVQTMVVRSACNCFGPSSSVTANIFRHCCLLWIRPGTGLSSSAN